MIINSRFISNSKIFIPKMRIIPNQSLLPFIKANPSHFSNVKFLTNQSGIRYLSTFQKSFSKEKTKSYEWLLYTSLLIAGFSTFNLQSPKVQLESQVPKYDDPSIPMSERMSQYVKNLQQQICDELTKIDGKEFAKDSWTRKLGGEGISCVLQDGNVFEKAGVNISIVHGQLPLPAIKQMRANASEQLKGPGPYQFFTASLSLVLHPHNPFAPTVHLNYRYFEIIDPKDPSNKVWWFGGGSDLTPSYLIEDDAKHFHHVLKEACDKHDPTFYTNFKQWCDKYFYNTHRQEARGIGGIFFDDLDSKDPEELFKFVRNCGDSFLPSYVPILTKRMNTPYTKEQKEWQQIRRGRYVEFNLIHDRGTKFGLATPNPRIESILVSLPKTATWAYNHQPEPNSPEQKLIDVLKQPKQWA